MKQATIHCAYLYADGHAVLVFEKHDPDAGNVQWAEIVERFGPACTFDGRIVLYRGSGLYNVIRKAKRVRASAANCKHGSDRTRELGIAVGTLEIQLSDDWADSVTIHDLPGVLSGPYSYQPETVEAFDPDASTWGHLRVARVHRVKVPASAPEGRTP